MKIKVLWFCACLVALTLNLPAQSSGANPEDQAIRRFFADADVAWNHHDAHQLVNPENATLDADFVNIYGGWAKGQDAFVPIMARLQAGPFHDDTRQTKVEKIRFIRPDVAVVITTIVDRHGDGPPAETRGSFVLSKEHGLWLVNFFQNTTVAGPPSPPQTQPAPPHPTH